MEIKEQDKKTRKKLTHNLGLKLASLLLAFVLWFLVVQINDPIDQRVFRNIQVQLINTELLEQENKVYEVLDETDTVRVTVTAPGSVLNQMTASDIIAQADVSKITDINTIGIDFDAPNVEVSEIVGNPNIMRLSVEDRRTKWVSLTTNITGEVADGYMLGTVSLDPNTINVSGPQSLVDQISSARVDLDVSGVSSRLSANVPIQLFDADGNVMEQTSLVKSVSLANLNVEVLAVKEVPISVSYMGIPADGHVVTGEIECSPTTVLIAGSNSVLANVSQITIPEDRMNITGESSDMTDIVNLREYLPDNVRLADSSFNGRVSVTVHIEPIVTRSLHVPVRNITLQNVPEGYLAALPEEITSYDLVVSGLGEYVDPLSQNAQMGVIDITAWMAEQGITELTPGVYQIPISFETAEEITATEPTASVIITAIEEGE